jgi:hypothetical protein
MRLPLVILALTALALPVSAAEKTAKVSFKKTLLDPKFRSEGVATADFNKDGKLDIAAGSVYYTAPDWQMHLVQEQALEFDPKGYSGSFCDFAEDLNGDGWSDLIVVGFPGESTNWYENPQGVSGAWKKHECVPVTNNESPTYLDVFGDGQRRLVFAAGDQMALAGKVADPTALWAIRLISAHKAPGTEKYSHGLGVGDINKDGRSDVLVSQGWWEQPAKDDGASEWTFHAAPFTDSVSNMHVYDFDGDGDNDVLCSSAHAFGIWWHEQTPEGWQQHEIDRSFSQTHSMCLADINGDGLADFVTGKRWWAHAAGDPGVDEPAVINWFELTRKDGRPVWIPHQFDHDSGVGTQFEVTDMNGDGLLDVVTSSKKGTVLHTQSRE